MDAWRALWFKSLRNGDSQTIEINVPEQGNLRYHPKSRWTGRRKEPLTVNVECRNAFVVVLGCLTVSKLVIETICDGSKRLSLVATEPDIHVERQGIVVTVFRNFESGTFKVMQFRFKQEELPCFVVSAGREYYRSSHQTTLTRKPAI